MGAGRQEPTRARMCNGQSHSSAARRAPRPPRACRRGLFARARGAGARRTTALLTALLAEAGEKPVVRLELVVERLLLGVARAVRLEAVDDLLQEVRALRLAAEVVVQPCEVHMEVVELRLVVHKHAQVVRLDAVRLAEGAHALVEDAAKERQVLRGQVAQAADVAPVADGEAVEVLDGGVAAPRRPQLRVGGARRVRLPLCVDVEQEAGRLGRVVEEYALRLLAQVEALVDPRGRLWVERVDVRRDGGVVQRRRLGDKDAGLRAGPCNLLLARRRDHLECKSGPLPQHRGQGGRAAVVGVLSAAVGRERRLEMRSDV
mmetsp:Transcript_29768/g.98715  ORF Transcript_29768/g.98715 Transcript_29768/m.98715 type:complete len:318 (-) Transcript_29768:327-1280(-)